MTTRASCLMALALAGMPSLSAASGSAMNLLFFGNSFSQQNHVPNSVRVFAQVEGYPAPLVVEDLAGGADVDYYIDRVNNSPVSNVASPLIDGKTFDHVIIQGNSIEATYLGDPPNDFLPDAVALSQLVRSHPSGEGTRVVMFETWARGHINGFYVGPDAYFPGASAMQSEIRTNYNHAVEQINLAASDEIASVARIGTAYEYTDFSPMLYDFEGYHAAMLGSRLAGLVLYRTIYNEFVSDIPYSAVTPWVWITESEWISLTYIADTFDLHPRGDFDFDGDLDAADIDLLYSAEQGAVPTALPEFDVNFNINVNTMPNTEASDADTWVRQIMLTEYGDINFDGEVDFNDLLVVAQNYNSPTGGWASGNIDGQAGVSFSDLLLMAQNYGFSAADSSEFDPGFSADWTRARAMVPEPAALGAMLMACIVGRRR